MLGYVVCAVFGTNIGFLLSSMLASGKIDDLNWQIDGAEATLLSQMRALQRLAGPLSQVSDELHRLPAGRQCADAIREIDAVLSSL